MILTQAGYANSAHVIRAYVDTVERYQNADAFCVRLTLVDGEVVTVSRHDCQESARVALEDVVLQVDREAFHGSLEVLLDHAVLLLDALEKIQEQLGSISGAVRPW